MNPAGTRWAAETPLVVPTTQGWMGLQLAKQGEGRLWQLASSRQHQLWACVAARVEGGVTPDRSSWERIVSPSSPNLGTQTRRGQCQSEVRRGTVRPSATGSIARQRTLKTTVSLGCDWRQGRVRKVSLIIVEEYPPSTPSFPTLSTTGKTGLMGRAPCESHWMQAEAVALCA